MRQGHPSDLPWLALCIFTGSARSRLGLLSNPDRTNRAADAQPYVPPELGHPVGVREEGSKAVVDAELPGFTQVKIDVP